MRYLIFILILLVSCHADHNNKDSFVITFGSCNKQYEEQPLWDVILKNTPDLWIWLGDVIYADTDDMAIMQQRYQQQLRKKSYQKFCSKVPVIGTWDDHDYGVNNGGKEYPAKIGSQKLFLDFLNEPQTSKRRTQKGIYWAYTYEVSAKLKVKVLVLDTRYHRDMPGRNSDILGEKQWLWLENELKNSEANLHIVCSSIQVLSRKHRYEKWANFPDARKRLLSLLKTCNSVLLLSGDRHFSEISCLKRRNLFPVYEVTSSGMTHNASLPITVLRKENAEYRISDCFNENNFGVITINENKQLLSLQIRDINNHIALQKDISFSSLGVHHAK